MSSQNHNDQEESKEPASNLDSYSVSDKGSKEKGRSSVASKTVFKSRLLVQQPKKIDLFKNKVFYLDVQEVDGKSAENYFKKGVVDHGGKLSTRLAKHVTHVLWSNGQDKTL